MSTTTRDRQEIVDELGEIQSQILELVEQARATVAGALERSGDYAKNLAKRTLVLLEMPLVGNAGVAKVDLAAASSPAK